MKQKAFTLLFLFTSLFCQAQESEFTYIETPVVPHFTFVTQDGLFYRIHEEPSDNNTFGKVFLESYKRLKSFGADVEKPKGDLVIPTAIQNGDGDFADSYRVIYIDADFDDCDEITSITFPTNARGISFQSFSFKNTKQLKYIKFPKDLPRVYFSQGAFQGSGIEKLDLPNGVTKLSYDEFAGSRINKLVIPKSVNEIDDAAFRNCINLCHVYLYAPKPPLIDGGDPLFNDKVTIHVPASSIDDYKADSKWNNYNIIGDL